MEISGSITQIIYKNDENGFVVFLFDAEDDVITCTGNVLSPYVGMQLELSGDIVYHNRYGEQFQFSAYNIVHDTGEAGVFNYLKSGALPYISEDIAKRIMEKFGENALDIITKDTDRLLEISGIGPKKLEKIKLALEKNSYSRNTIVALSELGIFGNDAYRIYSVYKDDAKAKVMENPYQLIRDIKGFGFLKADRIARTLGIGETDIRRVKAAIVYLLFESRLEGHIFLYESELKKKLIQLLKYDVSDFDIAILELTIAGDVYRQPSETEPMIYLSALNRVENKAAKMTANLITKEAPYRFGIDEAFETIFANPNIDYDDSQKKAIKMALTNNIAIITGGPGTGKTTIVRAILEGLREMNLSYILAAPTGRAAKRLEESSGENAQTLHRLLSLRPKDETEEYNFEVEKLEVDMIIVDEMSMVDISLYQKLLEALSDYTTLVMVGDADQLPSVGPGQVLKDLSEIDKIPIVKLNTIHRTGDLSNIAVVAKNINEGVEPTFNQKNSDVFFLDETNERDFLNEVCELVETRLPSYYGFNPLNDIQIMSPQKKGMLGVINLNEVLQKRLNTNKKALKYNDKMFKLGDKVMQIKNNYDKEIKYKNIEKSSTNGVFNGDIGIVTELNEEEGYLKVLFSDDYYAVYYDDELSELQLAYAITVHKSQGSEFPCVIFISWMKNIFLNNRNLLYTGVTRAKELLIAMGRRDIFNEMIKNISIQKRNTTLKEKILKVLNFEKNLFDM